MNTTSSNYQKTEVITSVQRRRRWAGIPPIKIMMMGGWKDLKTMQHYIRKAGVSIKGITNNLNFE